MQQPSVQQINVSYDPQQDRLLLKVAVSDQQEIRVWLTYRVVREMFVTLNHEAHLPLPSPERTLDAVLGDSQTPEQAAHKFAQESEAVESLAALDFGSAYQPRASISSEQGALVTAASFILLNGALNSLQLACSGGIQVSMNLNKALVLALSRMLMSASKDAGWSLLKAAEPEAISSIVLQVPTEKQVLH